MEETVFLEEITDFDLVHFTPRAKSQFIFKADSIWQKVQAYPENYAISDVTDPENISVNYYPPLYYLIGAGIYRTAMLFGGNLFVRFYLLRLLQVFVSLLTIFFIWNILKLLNFSLFFRTIYLLIFTFWPQLCMFTIGLQPDVLGMLFITVIIYLYILNLKKGVQYFYILMGILFGCLLLIKIHYFIALSFPITFFHLLYYQIRYQKWDLKIFISAAIVMLISSPWFIHNLIHYKTLLPHAVLGKITGLSIFRRFWFFMSVGKKSTFPTAIAYFGWRDTKVPEVIYNVFYILIIISALSFTYYVARHVIKYIKGFLNRANNQLTKLFESSLQYYIIFSPLFLFIAFMLYIGMTISPYLNDQGRHYFPFIFPLLLIVVRYSRDIFKSRKIGNCYLIAITTFIFLSSIFSLIIVWHRYYVV